MELSALALTSASRRLTFLLDSLQIFSQKAALTTKTVCASRVFQRGNTRYLLEHRDDRRVPLLQEVEHHECVGVRRQAAAGGVADVAHLAEGDEERKASEAG